MITILKASNIVVVRLSEAILHNYVQTKNEAKDVTRCGDDRHGIKYLKTTSWWHEESAQLHT